MATPLQFPREGGSDGSDHVIRTKSFMNRTLTFWALQLYHPVPNTTFGGCRSRGRILRCGCLCLYRVCRCSFEGSTSARSAEVRGRGPRGSWGQSVEDSETVQLLQCNNWGSTTSDHRPWHQGRLCWPWLKSTGRKAIHHLGVSIDIGIQEELGVFPRCPEEPQQHRAESKLQTWWAM